MNQPNAVLTSDQEIANLRHRIALLEGQQTAKRALPGSTVTGAIAAAPLTLESIHDTHSRLLDKARELDAQVLALINGVAGTPGPKADGDPAAQTPVSWNGSLERMHKETAALETIIARSLDDVYRLSSRLGVPRELPSANGSKANYDR